MQAMYQMLDPGFVGLIISAFNEVLKFIAFLSACLQGFG